MLSGAAPIRPGEELPVDALAAWLQLPAVTVRQFPGGHSNLTYELTTPDGRQLILRRPPHGPNQTPSPRLPPPQPPHQTRPPIRPPSAPPQDQYGRAEGYGIVHADQQYIVPTDGKPIRGLIQVGGVCLEGVGG